MLDGFVLYSFMFSWSYLLLAAKFLLGDVDDDITGPSLCLRTAPDFQALVSCLDTYTVPRDYYTPLTYSLAQPLPAQRDAWKGAINALLSVDGNCSSTIVPHALQGMYAIAPFQGHCLLYETTSQCGTYKKGWGFVAVPARQAAVSRALHVAAPHPGFDRGTVEQAAAVYARTGARSLLVAGRSRIALRAPTTCIQRRAGAQAYYVTDPAHNDQEPFFDASLALAAWQDTRGGGCPPASCAFLQFHGKGATTCAKDTIFLSAGLGNSTASRAWYKSPSQAPAKSLSQALTTFFPEYTVTLPADSPCTLTATTNVVGRFLNGVPRSEVCSVPASSRFATGTFVHAEQAPEAREGMQYERWARAVREAVGAVCTVDRVLDEKTNMCMAAPLGRSRWDGVCDRGAMGVDPPRRSVWYMLACYFMLL